MPLCSNMFDMNINESFPNKPFGYSCSRGVHWNQSSGRLPTIASLCDHSLQTFHAYLDFVPQVYRPPHPFPKLMVDLTESVPHANLDVVPGSRLATTWAIQYNNCSRRTRGHPLPMPGCSNNYYYSRRRWHGTRALQKNPFSASFPTNFSHPLQPRLHQRGISSTSHLL
jgi:hypothetical protein